jgi:hypothetical protein
VFHLYAANHELALRTWVQLLEGEGRDDIWLWEAGDEERLRNYSKLNLRGDSARHRWDSDFIPGWRLTDLDIQLGIWALARRMKNVRSGIMESLHVTERRNRFRAAYPSFRFAAIAWSIVTSNAVRCADASRGLQKRYIPSLVQELEDVTAFPHSENPMPSEARHHYDCMMKEGHTCANEGILGRCYSWIYIRSLVNDELNYKGLCGKSCGSFQPEFRYGLSIQD